MRSSMRGLGIALLASLILAGAIVYALLPAAEVTIGVINLVPGAMQNADDSRRVKEQKKGNETE